MLIDVSRYVGSLKKLWSDTFGDNEEYISLLFDREYTPAECFAEIIDGEVISCLYLLKGYIKTEGMLYEGRYLYAAATAELHRGKGLMAKLIKEAQQYIKDKGLSFISLVPANDGLYGYYRKFEFEAVMKNYMSVCGDVQFNGKSVKKLSDSEFLTLRNQLPEPYFTFAENEWKYALSCLRYADCELIRNSADSYCIVSGDNSEVIEYVSSEEHFNENTRLLLSRLDGGTTIVSPYTLSPYCECKVNRFGMVYFADDKMRKNLTGDIYMNIALD